MSCRGRPGLGSLTLALLEAEARVVAVEIDSALAAALPKTVAEHAPDQQQQLAWSTPMLST